MVTDCADPDVIERLRLAGLRPTRQRIALGGLLFGRPARHLTAEQLHTEASAADVSVSLATVYNTLNQFVEAGLLREVVVEPGRSYFDTNTDDHHHFYFIDRGLLCDIPGNHVAVASLPPVPDGAEIDRVDVIVRVRSRPDPARSV